MKRFFSALIRKLTYPWWRIPITVTSFLLLLMVFWITLSAVLATHKILIGGSSIAPGFLKNLKPAELSGEGDGRINILLIGISGSGHDGPNLSDTMLIASIDPINKTIALLSAPRDLYVEIPEHGFAIINSAYALGEDEKSSGGGAALLEKTLSTLLDIPIHYYVVADFTGFEKAIDIIGGIDITVLKAINDPFYPARYGYGYDPFYITSGKKHFDGATALKFARSRETTSDFDRASRQQQIIMAAKQKVLSLSFLTNPKKITSLLKTLGDHARTDLELWEILRLKELMGDVDQNKIVTRVIDNQTPGLLVDGKINGMYVLQPKNGVASIQEFVRQFFLEPYIISESAQIQILNGTTRLGIAQRVADWLMTFGYNVSSVKNADKNDYSKTVIVDYSNGNKPFTLELLKKRFSASVLKGKIDSP